MHACRQLTTHNSQFACRSIDFTTSCVAWSAMLQLERESYISAVKLAATDSNDSAHLQHVPVGVVPAPPRDWLPGKSSWSREPLTWRCLQKPE